MRMYFLSFHTRFLVLASHKFKNCQKQQGVSPVRVRCNLSKTYFGPYLGMVMYLFLNALVLDAFVLMCFQFLISYCLIMSWMFMPVSKQLLAMLEKQIK